MTLQQLRCFLAVAETLHFGRAARQLDILPAALGRHVRLLEEALGTRLLIRTTRSVSLTQDGSALIDGARALVAKADDLGSRFRARTRQHIRTLRIGAIDTAAAGLVPLLLHDLRARAAGLDVRLLEDKTARLIPRLLSGAIDVAFVRPPQRAEKRLELLPLFKESAVVAVPTSHPLSIRKRLTIGALADQPLIVPDRRSRPHSHDLTVKLFREAGLSPRIAQVAEEKQTIVNPVAAEIGLAIVPRGTSRLAVPGVRFVTLISQACRDLRLLPLAAAWLRGSRDILRDELLSLLSSRLGYYARMA